MAGLFADFGQTDPAEVRKELVDQQRTQFKNLIDAAPTKREKAAGNLVEGLTGLAQSGVFGEKAADFTKVRSPELDAAQSQADLLSGISNIEADKTSADFAFQAAKLARDAGDDKTALNLLMEGDKRRKAEQASVAKQELAAIEGDRKQFSAMPEDLKLAAIAKDPARAARMLGVDAAVATEIADVATKTLKTRQLKNEKAINDLRPVKTTKSSKTDVDQTMGLLDAEGIGGHTFEGWFGKDDSEAFRNFATTMDQQSTAVIDAAAGNGIRLTKQQVIADAMNKAREAGGLTQVSPTDVTDINSAVLNEIFNQQINELAGAPAREATKPAAPSKRRRVKLN